MIENYANVSFKRFQNGQKVGSYLVLNVIMILKGGGSFAFKCEWKLNFFGFKCDNDIKLQIIWMKMV